MLTVIVSGLLSAEKIIGAMPFDCSPVYMDGTAPLLAVRAECDVIRGTGAQSAAGNSRAGCVLRTRPPASAAPLRYPKLTPATRARYEAYDAQQRRPPAAKPIPPPFPPGRERVGLCPQRPWGNSNPHDRRGSLDYKPPGQGIAALQSSPVRCSPASRLRSACGFRADPGPGSATICLKFRKIAIMQNID